MSLFGAASYGAAAFAFAVLAVLMLVSWRGGRAGGLLIAACVATVIWSLLLSLEHATGRAPALILYAGEAARNAGWLLALLAVGASAVRPALARVTRLFCIFLALAVVGAPVLERAGVLVVSPTLLLSRTGLISALLALILLEQIYRNASEQARYALRYFTIGVGALFAYDLFVYSETELFRALPAEAWGARGVLNALAVPFIALAARRNPQWSLDLFVSRQAVFYSTTFLVVGGYLVVMALGGYYVKQIGGAWSGVGQILFFSGAIVVLASLISSGALRRRAQVFLSKHFYRNKYDYRIEWLRFIGTLSSSEEVDVRRTTVRAVAQVFDSPGGLLFLHQEADDTFAPCAAWPMRPEDVPHARPLPRDSELVQFMARRQWVIDLREYKRSPDLYLNIVLPDWVREHSTLRILSPLVQQDRLYGFIALYEPPPPFELTYEDRDLLKTLGRHVATHLAQQDADRKLAESRQFEAYNRLTAFMMHDLKNSAAQLKLIVDNAERHKRNPEFVDDAIGTIANAVERITRLIEQLRGSVRLEALAQVDLNSIAAEAVGRCASRSPAPRLVACGEPVFVSASRERLVSTLEHLLRNAQDATDQHGEVLIEVSHADGVAQVSVADTGEGMDPAFIRDRLFRPFDSTKGSKGMGIGAYQVREHILEIGGKLEVQSSPGAGARFTIKLPLLQSASTADVAVLT